ncbi:MAG: indole-3-glycerol phosphate synthase TrpC [Armatimonadota bacterium]
MTVLDEIVAHKREEVAAARMAVPVSMLAEDARRARPPLDLFEALAQGGLSVIAEIKQKSPSAGMIRQGADAAEIARQYVAAGARAISVLTDERHFGGRAEHLQAVRAAVPVPVLRKDFIVEDYQVYESRALGADAVLLIASLFDQPALRQLIVLAASLGMSALVEVHTEPEVVRALAADAEIIGINNRDLRSFEVDLETTARLRPCVPPGVLVVSESGIETPADVARVCRAGVDAILVGTALMASPDPGARLRALLTASEQTGG